MDALKRADKEQKQYDLKMKHIALINQLDIAKDTHKIALKAFYNTQFELRNENYVDALWYARISKETELRDFETKHRLQPALLQYR